LIALKMAERVKPVSFDDSVNVNIYFLLFSFNVAVNINQK
jgi:hypothetical protein